MNETSAMIRPFPGEIAETRIVAYTEEMLAARDEATIEAYTCILEKFANWLALRPGNVGQFYPQMITRTAIEGFLETLPSSVIKSRPAPPSPASVQSSVCPWLLRRVSGERCVLAAPRPGACVPQGRVDHGRA